MRTEHIMYLAEVGRWHHLSLAGERLGITPQTIGKAIQTLEKELHTPLLERTVSGAFLTAEGEKLTALCSAFLRQTEEIAQRYSPQNAPVCPTLTILTNPSGAVHQKLLPQLIRQIYQQQPALRLHVIPTATNDIANKILDESADLALVYYLPPLAANAADELQVEPLFRCQVVCQTSQSNPFALKPPLAMQDILNYPLIAQQPESDLDFNVLELLPVQPQHTAYPVYSDAAYQEMVRSGDGIGLAITLPEPWRKPLEQIIDLPLLNGPQIFFGCLYWNSSSWNAIYNSWLCVDP